MTEQGLPNTGILYLGACCHTGVFGRKLLAVVSFLLLHLLFLVNSARCQARGLPVYAREKAIIELYPSPGLTLLSEAEEAEASGNW